MENPYQSPSAPLVVRAKRDRNDHRLDDVAYGQKKIIYAILLYFGAAFSAQFIGVFVLFALLICIGMSWTGIYQITRGLEYAMWLRVFLLLLMLIPLVGLLVLLGLSSRATTTLKEAGYEVGLMGARNY
jgi:hypothetical protein